LQQHLEKERSMGKGAVSKNIPLAGIEAFAPDGDDCNVIIETPKGSRNKFKYDEKLGLFTLSGVLPEGAIFPFDFGFIPATRGEDGDPIDVLLLMDSSAFTGCLVCARLIGVIEAEQSESVGATTRNDRLIAVARESHRMRDITSLDMLGDVLLEEIEHFFISYNAIRERTFKPLGRFGPARARMLVIDALAARQSRRKRDKSMKKGGKDASKREAKNGLAGSKKGMKKPTRSRRPRPKE
jgi:inorganic pyrophosphatase